MSLDTTVVNLRRQPYQIYIGRSRTGQPPSQWGNPFVIGWAVSPHLTRELGDHPIVAQHPVGSYIGRAQSIALYRALLEVRIQRGELTAADFAPLYGKSLGCFCKPARCHGDVIAEFCQWFHDNPGAPVTS